MPSLCRRFVFAWSLAVIFVAPSYCDDAPQGRTSDSKTCADLFAKLAGDITKNEKLDALVLRPNSIPEGGVYVSKSGEVIVRPLGTEHREDIIVLGDAVKVREEMLGLLEKSKQEEREVIVTGDIPLSKLVQKIKELNLGRDVERIYFSTNPNGPAARAKQKLLGTAFKKVQFVVDLDVPSDRIGNSLHVTMSGKAEPSGSLGPVEFVSLRDLPGEGTLAERLLASRPPPDVLRITVTHYKALTGEAVLTDRSALPVSRLYADRLQQGTVDVYAGCNLMPKANGWLAIDGKVMSREFGELAARIADRFKEKATLTGRDILAEFDVLDHSDIGGWKNLAFGGGGSGGVPQGGGPPYDGVNPPSGGNGDRRNGGRASFRFLEILPFALAEGLAVAASQAGCDDDDQREGCRAGTVVLSLVNSIAFIRIGARSDLDQPETVAIALPTVTGDPGPLASDIVCNPIDEPDPQNTEAPERPGGSPPASPNKLLVEDKTADNNLPWFASFDEIAEIRRLIFPRVLDRPVLLFDAPRHRILLFEPCRQSSSDIPAPIINIRLDAKPSDQQRAKLSAVSARFWFYTGAEQDPIKTRKILLDWQETTGVTLPFIFLMEGEKPTSASWTLLKPFLTKITHAGESVPRNQKEAWASGLFWCSAHKTNVSFENYASLFRGLRGGHDVEEIPLRGDPTKELAKLLTKPEANAWLIGVWIDGGLRNPDGLVPNSRWVDAKSCNARISFVSAYPVSAPLPGKYIELRGTDVIPSGILKLKELAERDEGFLGAKNDLEAFFRSLNKKGGVIAVSSCGKYLLISE